MSFDPTGRYKGNRFDPNFAAKKGYAQKNKQQQQHQHQQQHQNQQHQHNKQPYQKPDQGWGTPYQQRSRDDAGPGGGGGYDGARFGPDPSASPSSSYPAHGGDHHTRPFNNNNTLNNHSNHSPHFDHYNHFDSGYNGNNNSNQQSHDRPFSRSDSRSMGSDRRMGNQQSFNPEPDSGYGARNERDYHPQFHGNGNGVFNNLLQVDALPYDAITPPDGALSFAGNRSLNGGMSMEQQQQHQQQQPSSTYASVAAASTSAPGPAPSPVVPAPTQQPATIPPSPVPTTMSVPAATTTAAAATAERAATASPVSGRSTLNSLEKLRLFKAQVEASRARKASQTGAESVTRVAESFLLSQAESNATTTIAAGTPPVADGSGAPTAGTPAHQGPAAAATPSDTAEEGEIPDGPMGLEQKLKAKLRQKKLLANGGAIAGNASPQPQPQPQTPAQPPAQTQSPRPPARAAGSAPAPTPAMSKPQPQTQAAPPPQPQPQTQTQPQRQARPSALDLAATKKTSKNENKKETSPSKKPRQLSPHSRRTTLTAADGAAGPTPARTAYNREDRYQNHQQSRGRSASPRPRLRITGSPQRYDSPPPMSAPPRRQASPPRRQASPPPPPRRESSDYHNRHTERRASIAGRAYDNPPPSSDYSRQEPATPSTAAALTTPLTPSAQWVLKQMELLKAQMHELEKLVPIVMAAPTAKPEPAEVVAPRSRQLAMSPEYETPTRVYREPLPPHARRLSPPPSTHPSSYKERYEPPPAGPPVHESRKQYVPKHNGKPYDRPEQGYKKSSYDDNKPAYERPYESPYGKPPQERSFGSDRPYDDSYGKPPYDKPPYDKPYGAKPYKKNFQKYDNQDGDRDGGGYKDGYKKPYNKNHQNDDYYEKKPWYNKHKRDDHDGDGGYHPRGSGRGGYKNRGRGSYGNHGNRPYNNDSYHRDSYGGGGYDAERGRGGYDGERGGSSSSSRGNYRGGYRAGDH